MSLYRYLLTRQIDPKLDIDDEQTMVFVMLNPSTADEHQDDPTIRRCKGFAEREGCTDLKVINLFAYRATNPNDLIDAAEAGIDVIGEYNWEAWSDAFEFGMSSPGSRVVAAWGANAAHMYWGRTQISSLEGAATKFDQDLWCLGTTKDGHPRHPLYVRADQPLERWNP